jgi:Flp pilus assembly protein TadG
MKLSPRRPQDRRAAVAVEAAIVLPVLLIMMLGIWEVGRIIQVQQMLVNAAREGARLAAGGYVNSTPVTNTMVEQTVRDYLRSAGLPTTAVNNAQIILTCQVSPGWTHPSDAQPLDQFRVTVRIPAGAAFDSLRWSFVTKITSKSDMEAYVDWVSLNNVPIAVDTQLPL